MRSPSFLAVALTLPVLMGCLTTPTEVGDNGSSDAPPALDALTIPSIDYSHDHKDPALHGARSHGFTVVNAIEYAEGDIAPKAPLEGVASGGRFYAAKGGDLLVISSIREDARAGFAVVDASDARNPRLLGTYKSDLGSSEGEGVDVTDDGAFAFVALETAWSHPPTAPPSIEIVDLSDPAAPRMVRRLPGVMQPHIFHYFEADGRDFLLVGQYQATVAAVGAVHEANAVSSEVALYEFDRQALTLTPRWKHTFDPEQQGPVETFPHDSWVTTHAVTGERLLYQAGFSAGGLVFSLADPAQPKLIGQTLENGAAPVLRHHSFNPAPVAVDGVLATASVPRSRPGDGPGSAYLNLYDTADPTKPVFLGQWRHPDTAFLPGDDPPLNLHVPVFTGDGTRLLLPHMHGGLFAFDVSTKERMTSPEPIAFWIPPPEGLPPTPRYISVVMMAIEKDGVILATEVVSGNLYVLTLDV